MVRVALAIAILHREFPESVPLKVLSNAVGLNRFGLSRAFRAIMGMSLRDYTAEQKVARACELLPLKRHSISEIAQLVGFGDLPRFDKVFRKRVGMPPRDYRNGSRQSLKKARNY